jgi:hypothetical protein
MTKTYKHCHLKKCIHKDVCEYFPDRRPDCPICKRLGQIRLYVSGKNLVEKHWKIIIDMLTNGAQDEL